MNKKILLIGNSGLKHNYGDGQTAKVRLYFKKIHDEGFDVVFVDLEDFSRRPFSVFQKIKKGIAECDRIVLISASRGCKILIPFINRNNRKFNKPFILPLIGTSVLHSSLDKLSEEDKVDFLVNGNYSLCKQDKKTAKQLKKITYILPETGLLVKVFKEYYKLDNVFLLNNFRDFCLIKKENVSSDVLTLIFLSRVTKIKGIFDLLEVTKALIDEGHKLKLDIYGNKMLSHDEEMLLDSYIDGVNVNYCGAIDNDMVCETISHYNLFVFPTRYLGEGTPGVLAESLIAGTPILSSDFPQAKYILNNGNETIFYNMFDKEDLKNKLQNLIDDKIQLIELQKKAMIAGEGFTFKHERRVFLKYICGKAE